MGVFSALCRDQRVTLLDTRLYLPKDWVEDATLSPRTHSGRGPQLRSKCELALELVDSARQHGVRFGRGRCIRQGSRRGLEAFTVLFGRSQASAVWLVRSRSLSTCHSWASCNARLSLNRLKGTLKVSAGMGIKEDPPLALVKGMWCLAFALCVLQRRCEHLDIPSGTHARLPLLHRARLPGWPWRIIRCVAGMPGIATWRWSWLPCCFCSRSA